VLVGQVVKEGQCKDPIEGLRQPLFPLAGGEFGLAEAGRGSCHTAASDLEKRCTGVDAQVRPAMAVTEELPADHAVATAQVQDRGILGNRREHTPHSWLDPVPCLGEGLREALVEFTIELHQSCSDFVSHGSHYTSMDRKEAWLAARRYTPEQLRLAETILEEIRSGIDAGRAIRAHPQQGAGYLAKHVLIHVYRQVTRSGKWSFDPALLLRIRMKPIRTLSGVTTVTVLTKPFPCPGKCIFCPTDLRMPKSYLPDEPGAMRAVQHQFDPYEQTRSRLEALHAIGHPTDKIELLILGGTWSAYPQEYQAWFVQRCLDALNGFPSSSLENAQLANDAGDCKNVGLVIETRPDWVTLEEVRRLRSLGVTKVQVGLQSLDDRILEINRRGHNVEDTRRALSLLRATGFKTVVHWMPNLLGATLKSDREDFARIWLDPAIRPDEIKIYPCQLLGEAELHRYWLDGKYAPYSTEELVHLIADVKPLIPIYCRVNRVVRDIPSTHVLAGNKRTNLRQDVQAELRRRGTRCQCIRCREVRAHTIDRDPLELKDFEYSASEAEEHFLSFVTSENRLAGYLRLSLPGPASPKTGIPDLENAALVREVHVYGQSLSLGVTQDGAVQHRGIGSRLIEQAEVIAREQGYARVAIIAALGTRKYYRKLGYRLGESYMVKDVR